ncbi:uncharacterized protein SOCE26_051820 [Sorangium cellulosum]|uniref:Uncharacterized protein n=1 Tax=Sorangium cellulosum TaxID=56 RepID=A0A2L0EWP7_SORCE|nr:hypothetical protein [Sorangium cellulosum]AUX43728.1 uncharacterized protein SOCE26_051820 [Sorangium cellulosum]
MGPPGSNPRCERAELVQLLGRTLGSTVAAEVVDREGKKLGLKEKDAILPIEAVYQVLDSLAALPGAIGTAASIARTELRVAAVRRSLEQRSRR